MRCGAGFVGHVARGHVHNRRVHKRWKRREAPVRYTVEVLDELIRYVNNRHEKEKTEGAISKVCKYDVVY